MAARRQVCRAAAQERTTMDKELKNKYDAVCEWIASQRGAAIAYSGGMCSSLLLNICRRIHGDNCVCFTAHSELNPKWESEYADEYSKLLGARHIIIEVTPLKDREFAANTINKCERCCAVTYSKLKRCAARLGYGSIMTGAYVHEDEGYSDALHIFRRMGVSTPFADAGLTRKELALIAYELNIPNYSSAPYTCLADRIPSGIEITAEALARVAVAEGVIRDAGMTGITVEGKGDEVAMESSGTGYKRFLDNREKIISRLKSAGYSRVSFAVNPKRK